MITVNIQADSRYPIDRQRIRAVVEEILIKEGISSAVVVSVAIVGNRKMAGLHRQYMGLPGPTDVMSFPYMDTASNPKMKGKMFVEPEAAEGWVLGDIVISFPMVVKQAREKNVLVDQELEFLLRHGMEHLLGRHHE